MQHGSQEYVGHVPFVAFQVGVHPFHEIMKNARKNDVASLGHFWVDVNPGLFWTLDYIHWGVPTKNKRVQNCWIYIYIYVHQYKYKSKYIYIYTIIYVYKYAGNPWINKLRGFAKSWVKLQTEVTVRTMIGGLGPRSVRCHVASWEILYEYLEMEVLMGQTSIDGGLNTLPCLITGGICMLGWLVGKKGHPSPLVATIHSPCLFLELKQCREKCSHAWDMLDKTSQHTNFIC